MPEVQPLLGRDHLAGHLRPLRKDDVAGPAIVRDDRAGAAAVLPVMAAHAAAKEEVTDIVGIGGPLDLHDREDVPFVPVLNRQDRLFDLLLLPEDTSG